MTIALEDGEIILMRDENVRDYSGTETTLLLTNRRIIKITHDPRGNTKENAFALAWLRESKGTPNVRVGKGADGNKRLELYFQQGELFFSFNGATGEKKWATAIEKAYKARMKELAKSEKDPMTAAKLFAPVLEKIEAAKETLSQREQRTLSGKCPFCGAITTGQKGTEVKCDYCEHTFIIK